MHWADFPRPWPGAAGEFFRSVRWVRRSLTVPGSHPGSLAVCGSRPILPGAERIVPAGSGHALQLGRYVGLQRLPDGGHVISPAEIISNEPVQAAASGNLLG